MTVNGTKHESDVEPRLLLVHYLRETLGLTGTNIGCDTSSCGACTIHVDGESVKSCTMLAVQADGTDILTIEGLANGSELHPMQEAFRQNHGLQCGYCTPGMVMAAVSSPQGEPAPHRDRGALRPRGQPVPLHGLPQHREGGAGRGRRRGPGLTALTAPAVINAIVDAHSHVGVHDIPMPASPQRVWEAIQAAGGSQ